MYFEPITLYYDRGVVIPCGVTTCSL